MGGEIYRSKVNEGVHESNLVKANLTNLTSQLEGMIGRSAYKTFDPAE